MALEGLFALLFENNSTMQTILPQTLGNNARKNFVPLYRFDSLPIINSTEITF